MVVSAVTTVLLTVAAANALERRREERRSGEAERVFLGFGRAPLPCFLAVLRSCASPPRRPPSLLGEERACESLH